MSTEDRILISQPSLIQALGLSRATFYRRKNNDKSFPKPIKFYNSRQSGVYYLAEEVKYYISTLGTIEHE